MAELVCVEFPGYVANVDNMLRTLGGQGKISEVCSSVSTPKPVSPAYSFCCSVSLLGQQTTQNRSKSTLFVVVGTHRN